MAAPAGGWPARGADAIRVLGGARSPHTAVPWFAAGFIALWLLAFVWFGDGQWGDNVEQLVWAHGVEWGYHKHPPLPTWLLAAAIALAGPASWWPIALAGLCTVATGWLTHRVASRLLGAPWAAFALLVWGLQQAFSNRASLFNHNTVMMLAVAATAWCVLSALQSRREAWWLAAGAAAGAALLSKYQSVVPLAGILFALWRSDAMRAREVRRGMLRAAVVVVALVAPHVDWLLAHELGPLAYASQPGIALDAGERIASVASFVAQQVRLLLPALLFCALLSRRVAASSEAASAAAIDRRSRDAWLLGLVAFPLAATILAAPVLGLELQNHWGFQCLQFAGLALAWALRARVSAPQSTWLATAAVLHVVFIVVAVADMAPDRSATATRRNDAGYPAHELATAIALDWQRATTCPLRLVVGPSFEAGIVSAYSGGTARVLEDGEGGKSPWIDGDAAARDGAIYVGSDLERLPTRGASIVHSLDVSAAAPPPFQRVYWAIVPGERCADSR